MKKCYMLVLVAWGCLLPITTRSNDSDGLPPPDRFELMAEALRARSAGDPVAAEGALSQLHALVPEDPVILNMLEAVRQELQPEEGIPPPDTRRIPLSANIGPDIGNSGPERGEVSGREVAGIATGEPAEPLAEPENPDDPETGKYRAVTKEQLLREVAQGWRRPQVFDREFSVRQTRFDDGLRDKLRAITITRVSFAGAPLSRVIDTLSTLSIDYDPDEAGVNIVLIDPAGTDPEVNITLRNLSLARVLDFVVESVGYEYDVQPDAVVVRQGQGPGSRLETEFFPISRSTIIRLTGIGSSRPAESRQLLDPFSSLNTERESPPGAQSDEEEALKHFLQRAGVGFETVEGANLALADGQLIVTQTPRNMEKVRNILRRYTEVKQVEIETRFLEVRQGDLEELGFDWTVRAGGRTRLDPATGLPVLGADGQPERKHRHVFSNAPSRNLAGAFGVSQAESAVGVTSPPVVDAEGNPVPGINLVRPVRAPRIPNTIDLAADAGPFAAISGVMGEAEVALLIRALERRTGNDLMSAPKVTVLSGKTAEITVAQELRYPESYGDIQAQVGRGDSSGSGSAGVAITAGTPMDFVVRNVGVEMEVTPQVEDDDSISLLLEPRVTEFEGFVEYGGTSIAIASNTTVTVPSGFFQPIFSVRRVRTEVTVWDGATVVMGGLNREQAISVSDKVPILGDLPLLGRLFRSQGESSEKRNLLIFVTANLISPGGSPQRQQVGDVEPGALFQNPAIVTPGGAIRRDTGSAGGE